MCRAKRIQWKQALSINFKTLPALSNGRNIGGHWSRGFTAYNNITYFHFKCSTYSVVCFGEKRSWFILRKNFYSIFTCMYIRRRCLIYTCTDYGQLCNNTIYTFGYNSRRYSYYTHIHIHVCIYVYDVIGCRFFRVEWERDKFYTLPST